MALCSSLPMFSISSRIGLQTNKPSTICAKESPKNTANEKSNANRRRIWRHRKLKKVDEMSQWPRERNLFEEENLRHIRETRFDVQLDIRRLVLQENKFAVANDLAAEAKEYVEKDRDAYGGIKKPILHVLSNRMNEQGHYRPDGYYEVDRFRPGPGFSKEPKF